MLPEKIPEYLSTVSIGGVWGIGPQTAHLMQSYGIKTAWQFAEMPVERIKEIFHRPQLEIWNELNGASIFPVRTESEIEHRKSIQDTCMFRSPTSNLVFLKTELSRHTEEVCLSARREGLAGDSVSFFLKSRSGQYFRTDFKLQNHTSIPSQIISHIFKRLNKIYSPDSIILASSFKKSTAKKIFEKEKLPLPFLGEV